MTASRWSLGWDDIRTEAFAEFDERELELLCRELLEVEVSDRHAPDAELEGPPPKYGSGKDLGLTLQSPPRMAADTYRAQWGVVPLTNDAVGCTTVYSCKTGKTWQDKALKEARDGSTWAVDALLNGGHFVVIVNVPFERQRKKKKKSSTKVSEGASKLATAKRSKSKKTSHRFDTLEDELASAYGDRLRKVNPAAKDPKDRIRIVDANELRQFVRGRKPESLSLAFRDKLGTSPIPGLLSLGSWHLLHDRDRGLPEFAWDSARVALAKRLETVLKSDTSDAYEGATWLVGPPGVGKTRLVLEALGRDGLLRRRTVVAPSFDEAQTALREHRLHERYPSAILIVDDCPPHALDTLLRWLPQYNHHGKGALVVLTAISHESSEARTHSGIRRLDLLPLDVRTHEELVARETGEPVGSRRVETIARVTGGFPWFAVLVAREVQKGAPLPKTAADAAKLALCSHHEPGWEDEIWIRARTLLIAMLTDYIAWSSFSELDRDDLCKAVGLDHWSEVDRARRKCVERGLLRIRQQYTYVTPAILEREIARMLLAPPPDGPEPRGPFLERHVRRFLRRFYERLQKLGLDPAVLAELADPIICALEQDVPGLSVLGRNGVAGAELLFAGRYQPSRVARALHRRIDEVSLIELEARADIRGDLVFALEALASRRASFEDAEAALFRLAQAENEAYGNNATNVWASLFFVEANQTYCTFAEKLPLLCRRSRNGTAEQRTVALAGVGAALSTRGWNLAREELDGPYPRPTYAEARQARLDAWALLMELMKDPEPPVASKARNLGIDEFRGAIHSGLGMEVVQWLSTVMPLFQEPELRRLRNEITAAKIYDAPLIARTGAGEAFRALLEVAQPRSFAERLHQHVGAWSPEIERDDEDPTDRALAQEGLADPEHPILTELSWLTTEEAVRSIPFLIVLGEIDREAIALDPLVELARSNMADPLSAYLRGWTKAGREAEVDALLRTFRKDGALAVAVATTIWRIGATDERIRFLVEDLRAKRLPAGFLGNLVLGSWEKGASDDALEELLRALLDYSLQPAAAVALSLVVHRIRDGKTSALRWKDILARAVDRVASTRLAGMVAHLWELGAKQLVAMGEGATIAKLAVRILQAENNSRGPGEAWAALETSAQHNPSDAWSALAPCLDSSDHKVLRLAMGLASHGITPHLRTSDILDWVGHDSRRAYMAAQTAPMHQGRELPGLARELIICFGPDAPCSRVLAAQMQSTPRAVSSLATFLGEQIDRARRWREDAHPHVRIWAEQLHEQLEHSHELHAADEEYERRRWGT